MREYVMRGSRRRNDELVEEWAIRGQRISGYFTHPVGEIMRVLVAPACHLAEAFRTQCRHVDGGGSCHQPLIRTDIGRRLLPSDALLARLEGQHESPLPLGGVCHPVQP